MPTPRSGSRFSLWLALVCVLGVVAGPVCAQCTHQWPAGDPVTGLSAPGTFLTSWDPDGNGPQTPKLVVAGTFAVAGNEASSLVALFDPATGQWSALGSGVRDALSPFGEIRTAVTMPNGDLVVGGRFTLAGGAPANCVARWNGNSWSALGGHPFTNWVFSLAVLPNGNLAASGDSSVVAVWNGTSWSWLFPGFVNGVHALECLANGDLLAAGYVNQFYSSSEVRRWNGSIWSTVGQTGFGPDRHINDLLELPNGDIVAVGGFATGAHTGLGGVPNTGGVIRWNGSAWVAMGSGLNGVGDPDVASIVRLANGNLLAAGYVLRSGATALAGLAEWNGSAWTSYAGGLMGARGLFVWGNGDVYVDGAFETISSTTVGNIARWDGTAWSALGSGGSLGDVRAMTRLPNGDLVVGGTFTRLGATPLSHIARWDGAAWHPLGSGTGAQVRSLVTMPNGDIIAGGYYSHTGGVQVNNIGRWNGTSWSALGAGTNGGVLGLALLTNGDLIATGEFTMAGGVPAARIARWNGASWSALGSGLTSAIGYIAGKCLAVLPNGDLCVGGQFETAGSSAARNIARWDGATWSSFGNTLSFTSLVPNALAVDLTGGLVVGATGYNAAGTVQQWNGTTWSFLYTGPEEVTSLLALPNGTLLAGGSFTTFAGQPAANVVLWNGASWAPYGAGTDTRVRSLLLQPSGEIVLGGEFARAGDVASARVAHGVPTCPASAGVLPTGCVGPGGPLTLAATAMPFVGATFRAQATGFTANAVGVSVLGLGTTNVPLATIDPASLPGCSLLVTPDVVAIVLPSGGATTQQLGIPNTVALAGVTFAHQVGQFDGPGTPSYSVSSSNGLALTIGAL